MADISSYIAQIRNARRGEVVRDSITGALKTMNRDGINAERLSGRKADYFASAESVNNAFLTGILNGKNVSETSVVKGSMKPVQSGALYNLMYDLSTQFTDLLGD